MRTAVGALAVLVLAAHLAVLPATLEDIDSINFAMGVRHFDVAQHQPHPPGYPVYIALGKLATAALAAVGVGAPDVRGLAIWSALGAAMLVPLLFVFFRAIDGQERNEVRAAMAAAIAACAPLAWFNAARPMSDTIGLAVAFTSLAALASSLADARRPRQFDVLGALAAGIAIGIRSQMVFLALPLMLYTLLFSRRRLAMIGAFALGLAVWALPLVVLSGGPAGYLRALGSQAGEDFAGVVMLWTNPTPRVAVFALLDTFARPWDSPVLGGLMISLAAAGAVVLLMRAPRGLVLVLVTFAPYAIFHLLFQETLTTRYALPLVPLTAYLAAVTLTAGATRYAVIAAAGIAVASLAFGVPATSAFGREASPVFSMLGETRLLAARGARPIVGMHRRVLTETKRPRAYAGDPPGTLLAAPRDYEWLEVTRAWREGHDGETWFLADPRRTDLALIDRSHARTRSYRWPFNAPVYVGGIRPNEIDWHILNQPQWFLERGWALTPEIAGISDRDGWGPHRRPSIGWVRRRDSDSIMLIGGRHLGGDPPVTVVARLDDRPIASFEARPGYFMHLVDVPSTALAGNGRYAALTVAASASGAATPPVAIEQFDFQPRDRVVSGLDEGWFEPEYNPANAKSWRWMSGRAYVRVHNAGRPVMLRFSAEAPRRYFDAAPIVRVLAGERVLSEVRTADDFTVAVDVPADALAAANGRLTITSDRSFVAGEREGTADRRQLALRVFSLTVEEK